MTLKQYSIYERIQTLSLNISNAFSKSCWKQQCRRRKREQKHDIIIISRLFVVIYTQNYYENL